MTHKMGIIGFGGMAGGYHYETTLRADVPFETTAVYDISPDRRNYAKSKGLAAFDNVDDFLASGLFDFVLVATSNQYHCEYVCKALEAGCAAMSEKPVAMTSGELQKMIDTSERTGKLFTVHHNRRWDRDFMIVKESIESGDIGKPYMIESRIHSENGSGWMGGWRGMTDHGGGMLLDWGVHMLDQILYLIKEPIKTVSANVFPINSEEVDDYAKVIITFESGLVAQIEVATYAPIGQPRFAAYGDKGALLYTGGETGHVRRIKNSDFTYGDAIQYNNYQIGTRKQRQHHIHEWEEFSIPHSHIPQDWASLYKNVGAALDGTEELVVKPAEVMRCFKVIEAAFKSSKEGITVRF